MKRLLMINLWILLGAWILFLNDLENASLLILTVGIYFNLLSLNKRNGLRILSLFIVLYLAFNISAYSWIFKILMALYLSSFNEVIQALKKPSYNYFKMVWILTFGFYLCAFGFGMILVDYLAYWLITISQIFLAPSLFCLIKVLQKSKPSTHLAHLTNF